MTASAQQSLDAETETETLIAVAHALRGEGHDASEDGTGRGTPIIAIQERAVSENPDAGPGRAGFSVEGAAYTLEARHHVQAVAFDAKGSQVQLGEAGTAPTLRAMGHADSHQNGGGQLAVAFDPNQITSKANRSIPRGDVLHTLPGTTVPPMLATPWAVRRLTPRECERLMGFPDDFSLIPWRGKPAEACPDGPRYKALGNSWAVNVAEWVGERINEVEAWK